MVPNIVVDSDLIGLGVYLELQRGFEFDVDLDWAF
jgi:hypothetical protein